MAYTGKKPVDFVDVTQSQSMTVSDDLTVDTDTLVVDSTNNRVGIGATTVDATLQVGALNTVGSNRGAVSIKTEASDATIGESAIYIEEQSGAEGYYIGVESDGGLFFSNSGQTTPTLFLDDSNNVGIGTDSPTSLGTGITTLHLKGNSASQTDRAGGIRFERYDGAYGGAVYNADGAFYHDAGAYPMLFYTDGTERMRIDSSGNLLVGTTSFTGSGASSGKQVIQFSGTSQNGLYLDDTRTTSGGANAIVFGRGTTYCGKIETTLAPATNYLSASDYRLKEDVQPMTGATERVKALNPVNFAWKSDGSRVDGFLAHEAQEVVPAAVSGEKDAMLEKEYEVTPAVLDEDGNVVTEAVMGTRSVPDYQGIDQSKLVPLLTAALQEAIAKIETLEEKVAALENA
jgi:hypothetical protein